MIARIKRYLSKRLKKPFHSQPYEQRVRMIKNCYSHGRMKESFDRYFASVREQEWKLNPRSPFFDLISAYAAETEATCVHQLGCFTATESRWLIQSGYEGKVVASDYDHDRLEYLRRTFAESPASAVEFRELDLEGADYEGLRGAEMAVAYAVLSNIQPESLERIFAELKPLGVRVLVLCDIVRKESLTLSAEKAKSLPSTADNNWYHPYLALAARNGLGACLLPEFIATFQAHASAVFVVHDHLPAMIHDAAVSRAFRSYLARQDEMLRELDASDR